MRRTVMERAGKLKVGMASMTGKPLPIQRPVADDPLELLHRIEQREREISGQGYQADFYRFLTDLVYTADEAAGGKVAKAPDWPFLKLLSDAFIEEPLVLVEKSRRVFASWLTCALDVWIASGGQDPRWPALMNATGRRQVYIISRKFESSCFFLERRVRFIVEELELRDIRQVWPDFPRWIWKEGQALLSNGSRITSIAQGSDQLRGEAASLCHVEELSFFEKAESTISALLPTTRGGGHVIAITTPASGTFAKRIRDGELTSSRWT